MKKHLAWVLALALAASLAACGGSEAKTETAAGAPKTVERQETTEEAATAAEKQEEAAPAAEKQEETAPAEKKQEETPAEGTADTSSAEGTHYDVLNHTGTPMKTFTEGDFEYRFYMYVGYRERKCYNIAIRNNSDTATKLKGLIYGLTKEGDAIFCTNCNIDVLGPGQETMIYTEWNMVVDEQYKERDPNEVVDFDCSKVEYETRPEYIGSYADIHDDMAVDAVVNGSTMTVTFTNKGSEKLSYVEAYALFFDPEGNYLGGTKKYNVKGSDGNHDLAPEDSAVLEDTIPDGLNIGSIEIYLNGHK